MKVDLYDTTLRDGMQGEGVAFSLEDKLRLTRVFDDLGIQYIEGGWPGANPKDAEYFRRVREVRLNHAIVTAFSYTGRVGVPPAEDANIATVLAAHTPVVTIVGKSWDMHVHEVLRTSLDENLRMIRETVRFLRSQGRRVFYDAEQFFDGYKANASYALQTIQAARDGGAEIVILCDTNGGTMPWEVEEILRAVRANLGIPVGIHAHNDCELGVANTLAAVRAGATQVQGTVNGIGERVGNANLCSIIANLKLKMDVDCLDGEKLQRLTEVARLIGDLLDRPLDPRAPFVGESAFAHKAGLHADATFKCRQSYQHIRPELVGNRTRVLLSELAGKSSVLMKAAEFGPDYEVGKEEAVRIAQKIKDLESEGLSFENAEASAKLLFLRMRDGYRPAFTILDYGVAMEGKEREGPRVEARCRVRDGEEIREGRAVRHDPVHALHAALVDALAPAHALLAGVSLRNYRAHVLKNESGVERKHRVLAETALGDRSWWTVGCSANQIAAGWQAVVDGVEYLLARSGAV